MRTVGDRLRGQRQPLILAGVVAASVAVVTAALIALTLGTGEPEPALTEEPVSDRPLTLPLDLDQVGFERGAITPTDPTEGPDAVGYCNNAPRTDGLTEWMGNRLTDEGGRRRVAQLVARFRSSVDAAAFVSSNALVVDCESWETSNNTGTLRFTITEELPAAIYGDETRRFDLSATTDGPDLFLRIVLIRSGRDVAQFTYVSANRQELDRIEPLVAEATSALGFS